MLLRKEFSSIDRNSHFTTLQGGAIIRDWWRQPATTTFTFGDGVCKHEQTMRKTANTQLCTGMATKSPDMEFPRSTLWPPSPSNHTLNNM